MRVDANGAVAPEALIDLGRTEATSGIPESVSADGRLLTLRVSRSGQLPDVMLFHLDGTEKTLVSSGFAGDPAWARSGREVFFPGSMR